MKVLVVDDDPDIAEAVVLCFNVRWPDAEVLEASDGESAIDKVRRESPDIVVLDVGLPDMSGFDVMRTVRETSEVPVVMLSARDRHLDKVRGLEFGADDYVTKPFNAMELLARIRAVLRRTRRGDGSADPGAFEAGGLRFDFEAHEVTYCGKRVSLTPLEYRIFAQFVQGYPRVVRRSKLMEAVWGSDYANETDYLKVHVQRIRAKFSSVAPGFDPIANERGIGYRLNLGLDR